MYWVILDRVKHKGIRSFDLPPVALSEESKVWQNGTESEVASLRAYLVFLAVHVEPWYFLGFLAESLVKWLLTRDHSPKCARCEEMLTGNERIMEARLARAMTQDIEDTR